MKHRQKSSDFQKNLRLWENFIDIKMTRKLGGVDRVLLCSIYMFLTMCPCLPKAVDVPPTPKEILIYGGNGFIGSSTVEKLLSAGHNLTLVNRGNWYWDTETTVRPYVHHIFCDRLEPIESCSNLKKYLSSVEKIDVVVDFSAYHPQAISDALDLLNGKARLYIYISTDSVYEVCEKNHTDFTRETDAMRPFSKEKQEELMYQDSYGHRKLQCEEVLTEYRQNRNGPPFISLRLADVIGPRDNTYRWWIYQMWMKLRPYLDKDVVVPISHLTVPMSFVYVNDVAELIAQLVQNPNPAALDEAFNLAQQETFNLMTMLEDMKNELNLTDLKILTDNQRDTFSLFPSVRSGAIDISKATEILNWKPTAWKTVLRDTVNFYENVMKVKHFKSAKTDIIIKMQKHFTNNPSNIIRGLKDVYGLDLTRRQDEL